MGESKMPFESGIIPYTTNYAGIQEKKEDEQEQAADKENDKEKQ